MSGATLRFVILLADPENQVLGSGKGNSMREGFIKDLRNFRGSFRLTVYCPVTHDL